MTKTATVEVALTETQRRALKGHLEERRGREVLLTAALVFALLLATASAMRDVPRPAPLLVVVLIIAAAGLVAVAAIASYRKFQFDARTAQIVKRTVGDLAIETVYNDEGAYVRFVEVDGRRVELDKSIPPMRVGTIEYTAKRGHLVAIWDREGILAWSALGYEPSPTDRMRVTA